MLKKLIAMVLSIALPASVSAGPLRDAADRAGREISAEQREVQTKKGTRFWTGIALIAGGGTLAALGGREWGEDETGADDGEDVDASDDGEDSDGWGSKAMLGGGIAAAATGGLLLFFGRKSGPIVTANRGRVTVRHTIRF